MKLRSAMLDDSSIVLAWRNDPAAVAASRSASSVDPIAHAAWFPAVLNCPDHALFIATEDGRKLGMVRFDRRGDHWLVSINMDPEARGRGFGARALKKALALMGDQRFVAEIKADNAHSIRTFERCGFRRSGAMDGFLRFAWP